MTTHIGLSDDRIEAIIRDHDADPDGDLVHTGRELVQLAREVKARRAADRDPDHGFRNRVAPFASVTESLRTLAQRGIVELPASVREMLEDCHRLVAEMGAAAPGEGN